MSGGAYDYAFIRVNDFADEMKADTPLREEFKKHLIKVSEAMRAVEWVDSGDCGPGDEDSAIRSLRIDDAEFSTLEEVRGAVAGLAVAVSLSQQGQGKLNLDNVVQRLKELQTMVGTVILNHGGYERVCEIRDRDTGRSGT